VVCAGASGAVVLLDELDYETSRSYELTLRASDIVSGSVADTVVHINIEVRQALTRITDTVVVSLQLS